MMGVGEGSRFQPVKAIVIEEDNDDNNAEMEQIEEEKISSEESLGNISRGEVLDDDDEDEEYDEETNEMVTIKVNRKPAARLSLDDAASDILKQLDHIIQDDQHLK